MLVDMQRVDMQRVVDFELVLIRLFQAFANLPPARHAQIYCEACDRVQMHTFLEVRKKYSGKGKPGDVYICVPCGCTRIYGNERLGEEAAA